MSASERNSVTYVHVPATRTTRATRPLVRVRLTDRRDLQRVHTDFRVVHLQLAVPRVHDVQYTIDRQRCLRNIRRNDDLSPAVSRRLEDLRLQVGGHLRVDGQDSERRRLVELLKPLVDHLTGDFDVFLTGHEDEDIAGREGEVNLEDLLDGGVDIVLAGDL